MGWAPVRMASAAAGDPLFAGVPERLRVLHWHGDTMDLPAGAVALASCDRNLLQAFRAGAAAWGLQFHLEVDAFATAFPDDADAAPGLREDALEELAALTPHRDRVLGRFAALVAARAGYTSTRTFFTPRAETWEERFAADGPVYAAAVARMGIGAGQTVVDLGCGTGRALPALRAGVGDKGVVLGVDVTAAMLDAAARHGRNEHAALLLADACHLPLSSGSVDGIFSAGLIDHLPEPASALGDWARVTAPGGPPALPPLGPRRTRRPARPPTGPRRPARRDQPAARAGCGRLAAGPLRGRAAALPGPCRTGRLSFSAQCLGREVRLHRTRSEFHGRYGWLCAPALSPPPHCPSEAGVSGLVRGGNFRRHRG
ncbi:methyltransferase domain-containing protein [Streptomyces sp. RLB1-33]